MALVDVILTIDESDKASDYDFRVLDALERSYAVSRSTHRVGLLPRLNEALRRDQVVRDTWLGRRPLELTRCLTTEDKYEHLVVVLPLGSTWRAVNAGYMFIKDLIDNHGPSEMEGYEVSSTIRDYAHKNIVPLLDTKGEFSRYPFDHKIAFDLLFTLKLALTRGQIGRGQQETIESIYLYVDNRADTVDLSNRETRQLALLFKYRPLPM